MARFVLPGFVGPAAPADPPRAAHALALGRAKLAGSDFRYAVLFAPPERRAALTALYALWREVDEIAEECSDPAVAARKLGWWREEIESLVAGRPRHPASVALHAYARDGLSREPLDRLLAAVARSFASPGFESIASLIAHARDREGVLMALAARLLESDAAQVEDLGAGLRLARLIAGLGADVRRGRLDLPREELARRSIAESDVRERRPTAALTDLLADLHGRALSLLAPSREGSSIDRARLAPLAAVTAIARATLAEIAHDGYRVLERRVSLTPLRKLRLAWKAARAATRA